MPACQCQTPNNVLCYFFNTISQTDRTAGQCDKTPVNSFQSGYSSSNIFWPITRLGAKRGGRRRRPVNFNPERECRRRDILFWPSSRWSFWSGTFWHVQFMTLSTGHGKREKHLRKLGPGQLGIFFKLQFDWPLLPAHKLRGLHQSAL